MHGVHAHARRGFGTLAVGSVTAQLQLALRISTCGQLENQAGSTMKILAAGVMASTLEPGLENLQIFGRQPRRFTPGRGGTPKIQCIGKALGARHGIGQRFGRGACQFIFIDRCLYRLQTHIDPHQHGTRQQPAKVGHIGHLLATPEMLQQLHTHPHWQHDERWPGGVVEIEQQHVEKADTPHAVHHRIHGHQRRNRARCTQAITPHACIKNESKQRGSHTANQIKRQIGESAQCQFQCEAKQEQKHHIAQQVAGAAMQKNGGKRLQRLPARAGLIAHGPALGKTATWLQRRKLLACRLPLGMSGVAGCDDLPILQLLAKLLFLPHQRIKLTIGLVLEKRLGRLHRIALIACTALCHLLLEVVQKQRQLNRW